MKEARYIKNSTLAVYSGSWVGLHFPASTPARAGSHKNATEPAILPAMRAPPLANSEPQVSHLCPLWNPHRAMRGLRHNGRPGRRYVRLIARTHCAFRRTARDTFREGIDRGLEC